MNQVDNHSNISVIIPTYNTADFIEEAINSVWEQTLQPLEVIVVDDGSTDNTCDILKRNKNIEVYYQNNLGPASARNYGIQKSNGHFIAFLDADDLWKPDHLRRSFEVFQQHEDIDATMAKMKYWNFDCVHVDSLKSNVPFYSTSLCTMLIQKRMFNEIGMLDDSLRLSEDGDWISRFMDAGMKMHLIDYYSLV